MPGSLTASVLVLLTLAAVLGVGGAAKMRNPAAFSDAVVALRVPSLFPAGLVARVVPWLEVTLALLLLVSPSPLLVATAIVVAAMMAVYTWLIARALTFDSPIDCACFGILGSHRVSPLTLARNVLLLAMACVAIWIGIAGGSAPRAVSDLEADGWWSLAAALSAISVAITIVGSPSRSGSTPVEGGPEHDYERRPIPYGVLTLAEGRTATLAELAATQARLLVVLNPSCGPCTRIAERLDGWAAELAPAVGVVAIYPTAESASGAVEHNPELATWEPERNVRRVFSVGTPAAILLGADGFLAGGPVAGEGDVAAFMADVLAEVSVQPITGE